LLAANHLPVVSREAVLLQEVVFDQLGDLQRDLVRLSKRALKQREPLVSKFEKKLSRPKIPEMPERSWPRSNWKSEQLPCASYTVIGCVQVLQKTGARACEGFYATR